MGNNNLHPRQRRRNNNASRSDLQPDPNRRRQNEHAASSYFQSHDVDQWGGYRTCYDDDAYFDL